MTERKEEKKGLTQYEMFCQIVSAFGLTHLLDSLGENVSEQMAEHGIDTIKDFIHGSGSSRTVKVSDESGLLEMSVGPDQRAGTGRINYKLDITDPNTGKTLRLYGMQANVTPAGYSIIESGKGRGKRVMGNKARAALVLHPDDPDMQTATKKLISTHDVEQDGHEVSIILASARPQIPGNLNIAELTQDKPSGSVTAQLLMPVTIGVQSVRAVVLMPTLGKQRKDNVEVSVYNHGNISLQS